MSPRLATLVLIVQRVHVMDRRLGTQVHGDSLSFVPPDVRFVQVQHPTGRLYPVLLASSLWWDLHGPRYWLSEADGRVDPGRLGGDPAPHETCTSIDLEHDFVAPLLTV